MNKVEIEAKIAESLNIEQAVVRKVVNALLDEITLCMSEGIPVKLMNFGSFRPVQKAERRGTNPRNGSAIIIPSTRKVTFKPGRGLKEAVTRNMSS